MGDRRVVVLSDGDDIHNVAEARNVAASINCIRRVLSSQRSDIGCSEMSGVLIKELSILNEYIIASMKAYGIHPNNKESTKLIRLWANFLKHPSYIVSAHCCIVSKSLALEVIDSEKLFKWDREVRKVDRDVKKEAMEGKVKSLRGVPVYISYPTVSEVCECIKSNSEHLDRIIEKVRRSACDANA